jgi:amino-acid N-acetyltransferase
MPLKCWGSRRAGKGGEKGFMDIHDGRVSDAVRSRGESGPAGLHIRKAVVGDVGTIQKLVNEFASRGLMLGLSLSEIYEHLRDFTVAEKEGEIVGACALHIVWQDLAEIRSLVVEPGSRDLGIGRALVESCMAEARTLRLHRVFALTYQESFFLRLGFEPVEKSELPQKVWSDCMKCTKFPDCDETAVQRVLEE